jgi:hypothetical protein
MNESVTISHSCQTCGKPLRGRIDKKFCNKGCQNTFHNDRLRAERLECASIDSILRQNRRVLMGCLDGRATRILPREELLIRGLRFNYHTHYSDNHRGERYFYCYDHIFLPLASGDYLIVRRQEISEADKHFFNYKKRPYELQ